METESVTPVPHPVLSIQHLVREVLSYANDSNNSLASFGLVCKDWRDHSLSLRWRTTGIQDLVAFLRALAQVCRVTHPIID